MWYRTECDLLLEGKKHTHLSQGTKTQIFEASKPTLSLGQRVIKDDEDMARLALACLYGSESLDEWPTMSRIFECLPAWDTPEEDEGEADETDTTIASLGDFVTPSTIRPRATPSDLLLFFKPLPTTSLSRALDVLDVHLESGEILARWSVPAPLRWFLQSNASIAEQRSRANHMASYLSSFSVPFLLEGADESSVLRS